MKKSKLKKNKKRKEVDIFMYRKPRYKGRSIVDYIAAGFIILSAVVMGSTMIGKEILRDE